MTIKELKELLDSYDEDSRIMIYDDGCYKDIELIGMEQLRPSKPDWPFYERGGMMDGSHFDAVVLWNNRCI